MVYSIVVVFAVAAEVHAAETIAGSSVVAAVVCLAGVNVCEIVAAKREEPD